jgi:hypothetical protein
MKTPEQTFVDPAPAKYEALHADEYRFFSTDGSEAYCSPVEVPPTAPYAPLYHADITNTHASGSSSGSWVSTAEYKPAEHVGGVSGLDQFSPYAQAVGPGGVMNYVDLDFNSYENLAFGTIPGDGISDNPYI